MIDKEEQQFDFVENDFVGYETLEELAPIPAPKKALNPWDALHAQVHATAAFAVQLADWITEMHPEGQKFDPVINKFLKDIENLSNELDVRTN